MSFFNISFFSISKKKKLSEEKNLSEEIKSKLALEYSSIGVWEYKADENRVYFSEGSKQIIGVTSSDFGKNPKDWNDRVHPKDKAKYFQDFQDHLKGDKPMYDNLHRVRCEDGTYKWIRDRGKIVEWTPNGKYKRIIGTHTDITALKNSEAVTKNALHIATEQNNRLKNFAHIVTHNLKQHTCNLESLLELHKKAENENEKQDLFNHLFFLNIRVLNIFGFKTFSIISDKNN